MPIFFPIQGEIAAQGTPSDLASSGVDFFTMSESEHSKQSKSDLSRSQSKKSIRSNMDELISNEEDEGERNEEHDRFLGRLEATTSPEADGSIVWKYLETGDHRPMLFLLVFLYLATQMLASFADIWTSVW